MTIYVVPHMWVDYLTGEHITIYANNPNEALVKLGQLVNSSSDIFTPYIDAVWDFNRNYGVIYEYE